MAGRAGNLEGSVAPFKPRPGTWRGQFTHDGKSFQVYGSSKADVRRKWELRRRDMDRGARPATTSARTVGAELEAFLERDHDWAPATLNQYRWAAARIGDTSLAGVRLDKLSVEHVEAFLDAEAKDSSSSTLRILRGLLAQALDEALRRGRVVRNAARLARAPKAGVASSERRALTSAEVAALREAARGDRLEALLVLALATGARRGELLGLEWRDVDLAGRTLTIRQGVRRAELGGWELGATKTEGSNRTFGLGPEVIAALEAHKARQAAERRAQHVVMLSDLVFTSGVGGLLDPSNFRRWWDRLARRAGLTGVVFHELRHTVGTRLVDSGVPLSVVADMLGHENESMLIRTYRHRAGGELDVGALEAALLG